MCFLSLFLLISQGIRRVCACGFEGLGGDGCEYDEEQDKAAE